MVESLVEANLELMSGLSGLDSAFFYYGPGRQGDFLRRCMYSNTL